MKWFVNTLLNKNFWLSRNNYSDEKSNLSVTVVIPAYNEEDFIGETIEALLKQTYPIKIIVVNDHSKDRTSEIARSYKGVTVIDTIINQGSKSAALNCAIPLIETDIFICVDADTILKEDAVDQLLKAFNDPDTMIASGFVISKQQKNFWQSARYGEYMAGQVVAKSAQQNANCVLVASGCFFAIKTSFLRDHTFDTRTMAEDMDLTWVAIEHGYRITFVENAICYVNDPHNFYTYYHQVSRWYRGFFQNIKVRNFDLFTKNPKLGIIVYGYMFVSLSVLFGLVAAMFLGFQKITFLFFLFLFLTIVLSMHDGYKKKESIIEYPRHILNFIVLSFLTYYIYLESMVKELILNKKLDFWIKGH